MKNENFGKLKKVLKGRLFLKLIAYACIALGIFFSYGMLTFYIRNFATIPSSGGRIIFPFIIIGTFLFFVGMGLFSLKIYKNIYFYEDGLVIGKNDEKILYKDLHYFFISGLQPNTFAAIFLRKNDGEYVNIPAQGYPINGFREFQEDIVNITYPIAMENINNGGVEEFAFLPSKKSAIAFGFKAVAEKWKKLMEKADKIKITKEYIAIADEIYNWNEYDITAKFDTIIINDLNGKKIVRLPKIRVDRPNLLEALIWAFAKKN